MSDVATQKLTFYCKNVVAVAEGAEGFTEKALRLMTMSGEELSMDGESTDRYDVLEDGCQVRYFENSCSISCNFLTLAMKGSMESRRRGCWQFLSVIMAKL